MFYPVESLKRGGRFYLCWVADSWPLRFTTITHRQLWAQDIRRICDDLMDVISNESGRPTNRFSLRLSSQLLRGLARIYQKKVNIFLSEMCMINANVTKHTNKRYYTSDAREVQRTSRPRPQVTEQLPQITLPEEPDNEQRIVEIIENSRNVVPNIQDITLREATIPEFQLPPNDGFGEEHPDQALQLLADRTVEFMMQPTEPSHHSGMEGLDITDKSTRGDDSRLDKSRLMPDRQMERISEYDATFLKPIEGEEIIPGMDFEKEIPIPEIPDIPIPQEQVQLESGKPTKQASKKPILVESEEIELEALEEPQAKRRRVRKLIIDKKIKIDSHTIRTRINNPFLELRCEDSSDDIIEISVPCDVYMSRPCHAGLNIHTNLSHEISRLFIRNLGVVYRSPRAEREFQEQIMHPSRRSHTRSMLERIDEAEEPIPPQIADPEMSVPQDVTSKGILHEMEASKEVDITEMLTQKIDTLSQLERKRKTADDNVLTLKKQRSMGYLSFRESQKARQSAAENEVPIGEPENDPALQADKENIPQNMQICSENVPEVQLSQQAEKNVTAMLQEAGLADTQPVVEAVTSQRISRRQESEGTETPLGSLDRTKVSLGDSEQTTDSKRFIRDQWGTEGTMVKILKFMRNGVKPITIRTLITEGPLIAGYKSIIAARCFTSILKLKQHGFIVVQKCPNTYEIEDIDLGPRFM